MQYVVVCIHLDRHLAENLMYLIIYLCCLISWYDSALLPLISTHKHTSRCTLSTLTHTHKCFSSLFFVPPFLWQQLRHLPCTVNKSHTISVVTAGCISVAWWCVCVRVWWRGEEGLQGCFCVCVALLKIKAQGKGGFDWVGVVGRKAGGKWPSSLGKSDKWKCENSQSKNWHQALAE